VRHILATYLRSLTNEALVVSLFQVQLSLAKKHHLPLFLHSRAAHKDFVQILRDEGFGVDGGRTVGARGGVVHSFTGLPEEVSELVRFPVNAGFKSHLTSNLDFDGISRWVRTQVLLNDVLLMCDRQD
jgi:TatD DNase family protein